MDNEIRLKEGMGVKGTIYEEQKAIAALAAIHKIKVNGGVLDCNNTKPDTFIVYKQDNWHCAEIAYDHSAEYPVTFNGFIQAILNEPEKMKEKTVQLTPVLKAIVSKDEVRLIHEGVSLGAESFPTFKINELAAAKREVGQ